MTLSLRVLRPWTILGFFLFAVFLPAKLRAQDSITAQRQFTAPASIVSSSSTPAHRLFLSRPVFSLRNYPWLARNSFKSTTIRPDALLLEAQAVPPQRDVSWRLLPGNFLADQKTMWASFPKHLLFHGQHWLPTLSIISVTGGLIESDPYYAPYFRRTDEYEDFNEYLSKVNTDAFLAIGPATVYLVGRWRGDKFAQKTALFAGEAAADAMVFYAVAQEATHRARPIEIPPNGDFGDTFYDGHHGFLSNSFPSGHAAEAFAIATVFERRYRDHKWVPWLAYGVAGLICFSRLTLQSHFLSDIFMGSAIGYVTGRYVALQGQ